MFFYEISKFWFFDKLCTKITGNTFILQNKLFLVEIEPTRVNSHGPTAQNKHGANYVGLVESDERWKTVYSVWLYQVKFSGYPNF